MREIETLYVHELQDFIPELGKRLDSVRIPYFRGEADFNWGVVPSMLRKELSQTEFKDWVELESATISRFKRLSRGQLKQRPESELDWLAAGAQLGLPTRLSAWSESAYVALYFALQNPETDGVVYRIIPGPESEFLISHDYEMQPNDPRMFIPMHETLAAGNQKLCHLVHPLPSGNSQPVGFDELFDLSPEPYHFAKIIIPSESKRGMLDQLARSGTDARLLFPGPGGICRQIDDEIYHHTDSYDWMTYLS
ncbi:MAG: FRG domain-containing protein [Verrucomicrobiota bacterium]